MNRESRTPRMWAQVLFFRESLALGVLPDEATYVLIPTKINATKGMRIGDIISFYPQLPRTTPFDKSWGGRKAKWFAWEPKIIARRFRPVDEVASQTEPVEWKARKDADADREACRDAMAQTR